MFGDYPGAAKVVIVEDSCIRSQHQAVNCEPFRKLPAHHGTVRQIELTSGADDAACSCMIECRKRWIARYVLFESRLQPSHTRRKGPEV